MYHLTLSTDEEVYKLLLQLGTATINDLARRLKHKHETVARAVQRLEESGKVNILKSGNTRFISLRPTPINKRVRPDSKKRGEKGETENDVYTHPSLDIPIIRAKLCSERVPLDGFVCHPRTRGCDLSREWVRAHVNGEYQIAITKVGDFRPYNRNDDVAIEWTTSRLNLNTAYNGKVFLKGEDLTAYSIRAVEGKGGGLRVLSIRVHPRYVFHKNHLNTAIGEFREQIKDVCRALEVHGWGFDLSSITLSGEIHTAINDPVLGSKVGRYNQSPDDSLHFDHSHGLPECEVYGEDPDTVELMVRLPETIRSMSESLELLTATVNQIIEVQAKTLTIMMPKTTEQTQDVMFR